MKTVFKIMVRYVGSAAFIAIFLLALNLTVLFVLIGISARGDVSRFSVSTIAGDLIKVNGTYQLSETATKTLKEHYTWAMLLDNSGRVVWSRDLPADIPQEYTPADIASFSRWYLRDYPVYVWKHADGLLVLGMPQNSQWKHGIEMPVTLLSSWNMGLVVVVNILAAVSLAILFGWIFFRSLKPLVGAVEDLANGEPVNLPTGGQLSDLAEKLNSASVQLQEQKISLQKRDNTRTTWIAGVSHDIRTPLSMVMGYASELEEDVSLSAGTRAQAGTIRTQSEKIKDLISNLNLANKLEYDMQPLRVADIHVVELAREVVTEIANSGLDSAHSVQFLTEKEVEKVTVVGDRQLLSRAISNLIRNSIQHNPDGCAVIVTTAASFTHCSITVADNGVGYSQEILDTFRQAKEPEVLHSHGLGLTIVKQIVRAHGGTFDIRNRSSGGCFSEIMLPISTTK